MAIITTAFVWLVSVAESIILAVMSFFASHTYALDFYYGWNFGR